jgi:CMP-N,N'-diacetyllegionaminic acid synthase
MAINGLSVLAVVPARGGSKGLPGKNLRTIRGHTLIAHAARVAREIGALDVCVLSTDDPAIAEEGRRCGLDVPFVRPAELATDTANSVDMWRHAWLESEAAFGRRFEVSVLLEPTSPLRQPGDIVQTLERLVADGRNAAATVSPTPAHYTPQKTLTVGDDGTIGFYDPADWTARRQEIPAYYHRNGLCYAVRREHLVDGGHIVDADCAAVIIGRPVVNIDDEIDLRLAELLFEQDS